MAEERQRANQERAVLQEQAASLSAQLQQTQQQLSSGRIIFMAYHTCCSIACKALNIKRISEGDKIKHILSKELIKEAS